MALYDCLKKRKSEFRHVRITSCNREQYWTQNEATTSSSLCRNTCTTTKINKLEL